MSSTVRAQATRHGALDIRPADPQAAGPLVARAMNDNPTHRAVFGADALRRQQRLQAFFGVMLPWISTHGVLLGAFVDGRLVGVLGLLPPGRCQPRGWQLLRLGIGLLRGQGPLRALRLLRWLLAWRRADPALAHWHLGPLAVAPDRQRRGLGTALLAQGLARVDAARGLAHLETDLPRNVVLYERLGFAVTTQKTVLGVPNWFMQRPPAALHGSGQPPVACT